MDLISRQAAIRWVKTECNPYGKPTLDFESGKKVIEHLKQMPSAQFDKDINVPDKNVGKIGDLIERRAAIDALNGEIEITGKANAEAVKGYGRLVKDRIERLPSVQPEIIRCRDCKHWQDQEEGVVEVPICARPANKYEKFPFVMIIGGDGFCSYAERRTDERQT